MTTPAVDIPGYVAGTWTIDPAHSEIAFVARHLMVSKVRGHFNTFDAEIVTAPNPLDSTLTATVDLSSVTTGNEQRDNHLRSSDFFEIDKHPKMTYRSTGIRRDGDDFIIDGELSVKDVTRPVPLKLEVNGFGSDPWGGTRAGFSATGEINRHDFNVNWSAALETGGMVVGDRVQIQIEIEAVLKQ